jgi:NAD(P)H-flavin reductase
VIFREEIERLQGRLALKVVHILAQPPSKWEGEVGFISKSILDQYLPKPRVDNAFEVFICGPPPMMDAVEQALRDIGVPFGDYHSERFNLV